MLDYQTQQFRLLPLLASAYAQCFAGHFMNKMYVEVMEAIAEGNLDSLPEVSIILIFNILYLYYNSYMQLVLV